jgi:hypothetical protein
VFIQATQRASAFQLRFPSYRHGARQRERRRGLPQLAVGPNSRSPEDGMLRTYRLKRLLRLQYLVSRFSSTPASRPLARSSATKLRSSSATASGETRSSHSKRSCHSRSQASNGILGRNRTTSVSNRVASVACRCFACWRYNLGSDADDDQVLDDNLGPHVLVAQVPGLIGDGTGLQSCSTDQSICEVVNALEAARARSWAFRRRRQLETRKITGVPSGASPSEHLCHRPSTLLHRRRRGRRRSLGQA